MRAGLYSELLLRWGCAWRRKAAATSQECKNRGQLDELYCDEDNDLVADVPSDLKKLRDPATLTFTYTPVENPAVYQSVFKPLIDFRRPMQRQAIRVSTRAIELR